MDAADDLESSQTVSIVDARAELFFGGSGWVQWRIEDGGNGHYYKVVNHGAQLCWSEAQAAAVAAGGYLVTITNQAENSFVFSLVNNPLYWWYYGAGNGPWIGAHKESDSTGWGWAITGEAWSYNNFAANEPNDGYHGHFYNMTSAAQPASTWGDVHDCGSFSPTSYVIERSAPDGLIAHYTFGDGNTSVAHDNSGNGSDAVAHEVTACAGSSGQPNAAYCFNGTTSWVETPITGNQKPLTYAVRFRTGPDVSREQTIVDSDVCALYGQSILISYMGNPGKLVAQYHDGWLVTDFNLTPNTWYHVVATWSDKITVYANGQKVGEVDYGTPPSAMNGSNIRIGMHGPGGGLRFFEGAVDDLRIYNRALSATEVQLLYTAP